MRAPIAALLATLTLAPAAAAQDPNAPPPAASAPVPAQTVLTLQDAARLALERNVQIEIERTRPLAAREEVEQARGAFDPLGFADSRFDHRETPVASTVQSFFGTGAVIDEDEWNYGAGFRGSVPLGLEYSSIYNFRRLDSNSGFQALEKEYRPIWESRATLPLLKDLMYNENNVRVKRSSISYGISEEDFRRNLIDELTRVEAAYWELAAARSNEEVAKKSLKTASDLREQTKVQYEVGVVSRVRVTEAEAGVAEREVNLIQATNRAGNAQDNLLYRIAAPGAPEYATYQIVTENPTYVEYVVDDEVAIDKAMRLRPELASARRRVEDAELLLAYARNQRLPSLDLTAGYTFSGLSGPQKIPPGTCISTLDEAPDDGVPDGCDGVAPDNGRQPDFGPDSGSSSHSSFFQADGAHGWVAGAHFEIPIGNRTARHRVSQREIELRRANSELRRQEQDVILDVRRSARLLRSALQALDSTERRRLAQEETLRAEQERLRLGDSTPFNVLEREEDLAEAERDQITALQAYRDSIVGLERAQGTLLEARGISVEPLLQ